MGSVSQMYAPKAVLSAAIIKTTEMHVLLSVVTGRNMAYVSILGDKFHKMWGKFGMRLSKEEDTEIWKV